MRAVDSSSLLLPCLLSTLIVSCKTPSDDGDFPINPGGGHSGSGTGVDAPLADASSSDGEVASILGRVCVQSDLRDASSCASSGADGLTVRLGSSTAQTGANGSFRIATPTGANLVWRITGAAIIPSVMAYTTDLLIPAVTTTLYEDLLVQNGVQPVEGNGSLVARLVRNGMPLTAATATFGAAQNGVSFYDSNNPTSWDQDSTGAFGIAWLPSELAATYTLTVTPPLGTPVDQSVVVEDGSITFVTVDVP